MSSRLDLSTRAASTPRMAAWPWAAVAAVAVVLVAFGLRVYAVAWGLPYVDHPDEPAVGNAALGMLRRGDWNPRFFDYPSLYFYALRLVFAAHWRYGLAAGLYRDLAQLPLTTDLYLTTPGFFVWGRVLTAVVGAATAGLLYLVGRRWWSPGVGLAAAAVLATLPFHMRHSQYITVDVASALTTLLALGAALRLLDRPGWRDYALAGLATGLAASTKYNAGAVALAVVVAHGLRWRRESLRQFPRLPWAALWSLIGFLAATPYAALTFGSFLAGMWRQYADYGSATRGDLLGRWPVADYLEFFWSSGLYPLGTLAAALGIAAVIARRDRAGLVLLGFTVPYLLVFLSQPQHFMRNLMPIFPCLALFAGIGIAVATARLWALLTRAQPARSAWPAALALTTLVVAWPLVKSVELTRFEAQTDSKVRAGDYVRERLPHGAPIAVMLHPVQWANQPFITPTRNIGKHDAAWYRAQGYRYLVVNVRETDPATYDALRAAAQMQQVIPGDREGQPGPRIEVFDLGVHPELLAIERRVATFGRLRLLGFQRGAGELRPAFGPLEGAPAVPQGQALLLNLYWQPLAPLDADYAIFLHLLDAQGRTVAQRDTVIRAGDYPTSRWQPGELALDLADLPIPADLPAGEYQLEMGVYRMDTIERLPLPGVADNTLELATVTIGG